MTSVNEPLRGEPSRGARLPASPIQNAAFLAEHYGPAYRWLVTITGMVGVVAMVLAMTTVNVAVPDVMGAFGIGQDKAQWMSSAYMATMTAGMLLNAWLSGVLGERRTFIGALFFFSLGAVMASVEDAKALELLAKQQLALLAMAAQAKGLGRIVGKINTVSDAKVVRISLTLDPTEINQLLSAVDSAGTGSQDAPPAAPSQPSP